MENQKSKNKIHNSIMKTFVDLAYVNGWSVDIGVRFALQ